MKTINIKGDIITNDEKWVYDYFEKESTSPKDIQDTITDPTEDLEIIINSGGGNVHAGSEIYTTLKSHEGKVNVRIVGVGASSASVIAMAGDKISMSPTSQMMIHNVSMVVGGNHNDMNKSAEALKSHDKAIANAYVLKTGKSHDDILELMNKETWFDAKSAVEEGFADEILFQNEVPDMVASINNVTFTQDMIDKIRTLKAKADKELSTIEVKLNDEEIDRIMNSVLISVQNNLAKEEVKVTDDVVKMTNRYSRFTY